MAASRINSCRPVPACVLEALGVSVPPGTSGLRIRPNGIEFKSDSPFALWTEMTVGVQAPGFAAPIRCTGVVVACEGNRHGGYVTSVLFLDLTPWSKQRLRELARTSALD